MCIVLPHVIRSPPVGLITRCKQGQYEWLHWFPDPWLPVWCLHCLGNTCGCEYGGADRTLPLWWVFYSGLLPTVAGMAPSQKCHAEPYGCDGCKSLWSGIESAVKKLSEPSVLYSFWPPSVRSSSCQNSQHYALKSSIVYSVFWLVTDRFQSTFTCSCSVSALKFFAETSYYATLWSIVFKVSFVRITFYLPLKEQFTLKMKMQSLFNPLNAVSKPIWPFFINVLVSVSVKWN